MSDILGLIILVDCMEEVLIPAEEAWLGLPDRLLCRDLSICTTVTGCEEIAEECANEEQESPPLAL